MNTKLVLIVGPSGVGKDTLLKSSKNIFTKKINFVNRYITRKPDQNESNYFIDMHAFKVLEDNSFFISTWKAHNNIYGISKISIKKGINIISISRSKIKDFEDYYEDVYTINITVSQDILRKRLNQRNRETKEEIEDRLNRNYNNIKARKLIEFDNSNELNLSVNDFVELIENL